jgi:sterol desaturase/sphingolipid hydroxylase (fatty acid hydroxylase superfamily)
MWFLPVLLSAFGLYLIAAATFRPQWRGRWANRNAWPNGRQGVPMSVAGHFTFGLCLLWWAAAVCAAGWWFKPTWCIVWILLFLATMLIGIRDHRSYRAADRDWGR